MYILLKYVFTFLEFFGKSIGGNANVFACPAYLGHTPPIEMIQGNQGKLLWIVISLMFLPTNLNVNEPLR